MDLSLTVDLMVICGFSIVKVCMLLHPSVDSPISNEVWIWAAFFQRVGPLAGLQSSAHLFVFMKLGGSIYGKHVFSTKLLGG